jgi:putative peptide zinc metalloprotease protein
MEDNASGRAHRFTPEVYRFVGLMDGKKTVDEIWNHVVQNSGDDAPTQGEVIRLLSQLNAADLLQTDIAPNAIEMMDRFTKHSAARRRGYIGNPLAIKLPLWDPDRFLEKTLPAVSPAFTRLGALIWILTIFPALVLVGMHWSELTENISDRIFAIESLMLTALVFPMLKFFHELGHSYATKIAGGEVHELGVMLLVFAPVPYVDASASIVFKSKWQRALVGMAGMLTEVFIAALAVFAWTLMEPGFVRSLCFQIMLIAGVSTIVFNSNPLLRFDGYYILCDLLEIPNLGARSSRYWASLAERRVFGLEEAPAPVAPGESFWLLIYAPLALAYRGFVLFGISVFIASEFLVVGALIAGWGLIVGLGRPVWKAMKYVLTSTRVEKHRLRAASITFASIGLAVCGVLFIPFPLHTVSEGVVWLPEESYVRAANAGFVKAVASESGARVSVGDLLVETEEPELVASVRVLQSELAGLTQRLASEQFTDRVQADITRQEIALKESNLLLDLGRADALKVRSSVDGIFLSPAVHDLPGRYAKRGDVLGYVIFQQSRIARVVVTQDDIDLVRNKLNNVDVRMADRVSVSYLAKIVREVPAASESLPSKAFTEAGGGRFAADPRDSNQVKTLQRTFQFDLELPSDASNANFGSRILVRFDHGFEPLGTQWYRRLRQLFLSRFET